MNNRFQAYISFPMLGMAPELKRVDNGLQIKGDIFFMAEEGPNGVIANITDMGYRQPKPSTIDSLPVEAHELLSLKVKELEKENLTLKADLKSASDWNRQLEERLLKFVDLALASRALPS